jgi:hypothetical protein
MLWSLEGIEETPDSPEIAKTARDWIVWAGELAPFLSKRGSKSDALAACIEEQQQQFVRLTRFQHVELMHYS